GATPLGARSLHDALPISPSRRGRRLRSRLAPYFVQFADHAGQLRPQGLGGGGEAAAPATGGDGQRLPHHHVDPGPPAPARPESTDRKSTRLNSSHVKSSY